MKLIYIYHTKYDGEYLLAEIYGRERKIAKMSAAYYKEKHLQLFNKGYHADGCNVGFNVYWKGKDEKEETLILLPKIHYIKRC